MSIETSRDVHERPLTREELRRLEEAAEDSSNPQLKYIVALLILTRVRQRDLLEARWDQFDLVTGVWTIPSAHAGKERRVDLTGDAIALIRKLPRWKDCSFVLANPVTKRPYRSFQTSWDTARIKADLADVEIDDLRFFNNVNNDNAVHPAAGQLKRVTENFRQKKRVGG